MVKPSVMRGLLFMGPVVEVVPVERLDALAPVTRHRVLFEPLDEALAQLERALITRALTLADGNRAEAARRLGISRQSLYTRLASLGLSDSGN